MKLKLSELASIAEIIGAIAIVVSLIYVGVQVNDSTRAVRSATANETSAALSSWYTQIGASGDASEIFWRGMTQPESLSPPEMFQYIMQSHGIMLEYQAAYYLSQEGTLDLELRDSILGTIRGVGSLPGFLEYWDQRRGLFKADFRQTIDDILASGVTEPSIQRAYIPVEAE